MHRADIVLAAQRGYAGLAAEYRLTRSADEHPPHNQFPAGLYDVKAAIRWIRSNADSYGIDPNRIGVCGFSAGANYAMMAAMTGPEDGGELLHRWSHSPEKPTAPLGQNKCPR